MAVRFWPPFLSWSVSSRNSLILHAHLPECGRLLLCLWLGILSANLASPYCDRDAAGSCESHVRGAIQSTAEGALAGVDAARASLDTELHEVRAMRRVAQHDLADLRMQGVA